MLCAYNELTLNISYRGGKMSKIELNRPAPDFTLADFDGNNISLADYKGKMNVLLVFNRGFS